MTAPVNPLLVIPFLLLLLSISFFPFMNKRWWDKNYPFVVLGLTVIPFFYYVVVLQTPERMVRAGTEYVRFIILLSSLYVVAGGILVRLKGKSTPLTNLVYLSVGALVSNFLGTTGASVIMIRPYLRVNQYRLRGFHIVFFIFIVSNIGGGLTPIGDPPLFLGYLNGVPFLWVLENVWHIWAFVLGCVLLMFFLIDSISFRRFESSKESVPRKQLHEKAEVSGMHNVFFLAVITGLLFIHSPVFVRELLMALAAAASYFTTRKEIHEKNGFTFLPVKEIAILFLGIFVSMVPALDWIELNAAKSGITTAGQFFWGTGLLSSVLDNAPAYLNFLSASLGLFAHPGLPDANSIVDLIAHHGEVLKAISVASVFFGAMTYVGNGPNFMVKSIAEQLGAPCPGFGGYLAKYSLPILLPVFMLVWWIFF